MFNSFFQSAVFLYFTKLVAVIRSLIDTVFILEQHLQQWIIYIYNVFDRYFCLRRIVTSKELLQPYHLSGTVIISGGHFKGSSIFKGTVFLWNKYL